MARLTRGPIDPAAASGIAGPGDGAVVTFLGVVRDSSRGRKVTAIEFHAYEEMAVREMARIEEEVRRRWPGIEVDIVHRIGYLKIGEAALLVAVASPHREEGFAALRLAVERLKASVPIWKKEIYVDGHAWI